MAPVRLNGSDFAGLCGTIEHRFQGATAAPAGRPVSQRSSQEEVCMSDGLKLGQKVVDFELETYETANGEFGTFSLAQQIAKKRWTILFFYPADFTFV
jgi:hypothetical protein